MDHEYDCVVIGAGFSGICAARELAHAGLRVLVVEARDRIGGRTDTASYPGTEKKVEMGGTWVNPRYHKWVKQELHRYNIELTGDTDMTPVVRWNFNGEVGDDFPIKGAELFDFERALFKIIDASHRIDTNVPRDQQSLADLDVPVSQFIKDLGVPPSVAAMLSTMGKMGTGALDDDWSALTALSWVAAADNSAYAWLAGVAEKFKHGTAHAIRTILDDSKADLVLSSPVSEIVQSQDGVKIVTKKGRSIHARSAIVALPINCWRDVSFSPPLSVHKQQIASTGHRAAIRKVWMMAENVSEAPMYIGLDTSFSIIVKEYEIDGMDMLVGFSAAPELDVESGSSVEKALVQLIPGTKLVSHHAHDWAADPFSKGTWMANPPGQLSSTATSLQQREGRIAFAGADIATKWIGWIDGAIERGITAADDVKNLLKND